MNLVKICLFFLSLVYSEPCCKTCNLALKKYYSIPKSYKNCGETF